MHMRMEIVNNVTIWRPSWKKRPFWQNCIGWSDAGLYYTPAPLHTLQLEHYILYLFGGTWVPTIITLGQSYFLSPVSVNMLNK